jgi:hypothetical protein
MRRARRLRHTAPLAPGSDARHRRQPATRRHRDAGHDDRHRPVTHLESESSPCMPVLGPRRRRIARITPPPEAGPCDVRETDGTGRENRP